MIKRIILMTVFSLFVSNCVFASNCEIIPKSIRYYKKQVKTNPIDVCARYNLAYAYFRKNKVQKSANEFGLIIYINPKEEDAYIQRSCIFSIYNNKEASYRELAELLQNVPNSVQGNAYMSEIYENLLDYENALKHINVSIEQSDGNDAWYFYLRAMFLEKLGRYEEAIKDYTKYIEQDKSTDFWVPYARRSECYKTVGKEKEAEADIKIAEEMKKNDKYKRNIFERIESKYFLFQTRIHTVY